jgi:hypothetical protein
MGAWKNKKNEPENHHRDQIGPAFQTYRSDQPAAGTGDLKREISLLLPMADNPPEPAWTKRWQCYDRPGEKVRKQDDLASGEAALGPDRGLTTRASRSQAGRTHGKRRRRIWQEVAPDACSRAVGRGSVRPEHMVARQAEVPNVTKP